MPAWFGKKKGMTVAGINADNYSAVLQNIIMTGLIFQIDEITGNKVRVPLDKVNGLQVSTLTMTGCHITGLCGCVLMITERQQNRQMITRHG